jgi:hypothetical protein
MLPRQTSLATSGSHEQVHATRSFCHNQHGSLVSRVTADDPPNELTHKESQ